MEKNTEQELKLLISEPVYQQMSTQLPFDRERIQINTYYDSPDGELKNKGWALRIRQTEGQNILTVKKPRSDQSKYEYERIIHTNDLQRLSQDEQQWLKDLQIDTRLLLPFLQTKTLRKLWNTPDAEISLDHTWYGDQNDYELEYEFRSDHDGESMLNKILEPYHLRYEKNCPSKLARAAKALQQH